MFLFIVGLHAYSFPEGIWTKNVPWQMQSCLNYLNSFTIFTTIHWKLVFFNNLIMYFPYFRNLVADRNNMINASRDLVSAGEFPYMVNHFFKNIEN